MSTARGEILALVLQHGWNATAYQLLEPGYRYFRTSDGAVAYQDTGRAWVAAGAPLCDEGDLRALTGAFIQAAEDEGRSVCFAAIERRFLDHTGLHALAIGSQPIWDPTRWSETVASASSLREQLRRARKKGVAVRELSQEARAEPALRAALEEVTSAWLATKRLPALQFLLRVELFESSELRRLFVAERAGRIVALAALVPVPARGGWLLEDLLRDPTAPNGTSELLFDAVLRALASEGSRWLTPGLVPLEGEVALPLRIARRLASSLYDFDGLAHFRRRLRPLAWDPIYLAFPRRTGAIGAVLATMRALVGEPLHRYARRLV